MTDYHQAVRRHNYQGAGDKDGRPPSLITNVTMKLFRYTYLFVRPFRPYGFVSLSRFMWTTLKTLKLQFEQNQHHKTHTKIEALNTGKNAVKTQQRERRDATDFLIWPLPKMKDNLQFIKVFIVHVHCCFEKCRIITGMWQEYTIGKLVGASGFWNSGKKYQT